MISQEELHEYNKKDKFYSCYACKMEIKYYGTVYYSVVKNEINPKNDWLYTKNGTRCRIDFCEKCWQIVAGEDYMMDHQDRP